MSKASIVFNKYASVGDKVLKTGWNFIRSGEYGKALEHFKNYNRPLEYLSKDGIKKVTVNPVEADKNTGFFKKLLVGELGNTAYGVSKVKEGISKEKDIVAKFGKGVNNFLDLGTQQLRGAGYRIIPKGEANVVTKGGIPHIKGKGQFANYSIFDRPVHGYTNEGDFIVKKRAAMRPFSYASTGPGFAATGLVGAMAAKNRKERVTGTEEAIKDGLVWTAAPALGQAEMVADLIKN